MALVLALSGLGGCQSFTYQALIDKQAVSNEVVQSQPFKHRLLTNTRQAANTSKQTLHIYIEGDGVPWIGRYFVATDPTPKNSLMLAAMLEDPNESVYLGRPCYFHVDDSACSAEYWTMSRYSREVVNSMVLMVERLVADKDSVWIIGHSGGGALAVLIARRLSRPVNVLTVAANLNHAGWTQHHHYSPLVGSLDVAVDTARNPRMKEMHWFGSNDENVVPLWWTVVYCQNEQVNCQLAEAKHSSGWLRQWSKILREAKAYFESP